VLQLTGLIEAHAHAAHELLDRVETETAHSPNEVKDDSAQAENAYLKRKVSKLEVELKKTLAGAEERLQKERGLMHQVSPLHCSICQRPEIVIFVIARMPH
jgi:hypothetical protein